MAYGFYRSITVDHTQCGSADSTDWPMQFAGTYTYLKTVGNGGNVQSSFGYDIAFFADEALTTALDFERVNWDASTGTCEFFVKIPTLDHSTDSVIYIAYGDASISTDQQTSTATYDSNFKGVYHLKEDPDRGETTFLDSTASFNDLELEAGNPSWGTGSTTVTSVTGKGGNGISFNQPDQYAGMAARSHGNSGMGTGDTTIEGWIKVNNFLETDGGSGAFGVKIADSYPYHFNGIVNANPDSKIAFIVGPEVHPAYMAGPSSTLSTGVWYHVAGVHEGTTITLYVNGSSVDTSSVGSGTTEDVITLGFMDRSFDGALDEVRFSSCARSASWILSTYNNQNAPGSFYTVGDEVEIPSGIVKGNDTAVGLFEVSTTLSTVSYGAIAGGSGSLIVVGVLWDSTATTAAVTDDQSNTYQTVWETPASFTLDAYELTFYYNVYFAVDVAASATPVFTATFDVAPNFASMSVSDYSGFADTPSVDLADHTFASSGSHIISPSITTTQDADLVLGYQFNDTGSTSTVSPPFTYISGDGFGLGDVAFLITASADDYSANFGVNIAGQWAAATVAFRSGAAEEPEPSIVFGFFNVPALM